MQSLINRLHKCLDEIRAIEAEMWSALGDKEQPADSAALRDAVRDAVLEALEPQLTDLYIETPDGPVAASNLTEWTCDTADTITDSILRALPSGNQQAAGAPLLPGDGSTWYAPKPDMRS
jgi:hypothetical protein